MVSIVIADDHAVVRSGVRLLLEREPDFEVLAEVAAGGETLRRTLELAPDVLVLDLSMPGVNGLDVARRIGAAGIATRILVLSMHASDAYVYEAFKSGVAGYVVKDATAADLVEAVRTVVAGRRYLSAPLTFEQLRTYASRSGESADLYERLSGREKQVLELVAAGHTNADIATLLAVSVRTVEAHRAHLMTKLDVHGPQGLLRFAIRRGITRLDA